MIRKNLIGLRFGKLVVITKAQNILNNKNSNSRSYTAWQCQCDCGKIITVRTCTLLAKLSASCGCTISEFGLALKPDQKFNKLTTISYSDGFWKCLCDCGEVTECLTSHLISGNTKSCGCIKKQKSIENIKLAIKKNTKYNLKIASARRVWKTYIYTDKNCNLTFEEFYKISQQNCFYCGIKQSNKGKNKFNYNGLDKIDPNKYHTKDNVVSCCYICNRAKSNRDINVFYKYINSLNESMIVENYNQLKLPEKYLLTSIKIAYRHYLKNYKCMEIDLQTFYSYSQLPCVYCGLKNSNCYNVYLKDKKASGLAKQSAYFYYNGLDRIDNNKNHNKENIVPCCKYCNFAKSNLELKVFFEWIKNIKRKSRENPAFSQLNLLNQTRLLDAWAEVEYCVSK